MVTFAEINLDPGGIIAWAVVGLVAGCLAGFMMRGAGYGLVGDLVVGLLGALVGGFLFGMVSSGTAGFWGSIGVAFGGACVLIVLAEFVGLRRSRP